jgi:valyl-tRNA synthetase
MKKAMGGSYYAVEIDDIFTKKKGLRKLAADSIAKLKAEGKYDLAAHLERLDKTVIDLETEMKGLNSKSESGKQVLSSLEKALKEAETKSKAELKKIVGKFLLCNHCEQRPTESSHRNGKTA